MWQDVRLDPGASVEATDGRFGTLDEVIVRPDSGELSYLVVRHAGSRVTVPATFIDAIPNPLEVRLNATRETIRDRAAGTMLAGENGSEIRIPILEERLRAGTRGVDLGEVRLHKYIERVEEVIRQPVTRDDLQIERVTVNRPLEGPVMPREEDGWFVIPIMKEVLVVSKRLMLAEEVRVRKRQIVEEQEVRDEVRREHISVEDATLPGMRGLARVPGVIRSAPDGTNGDGPAELTEALPDTRPASESSKGERAERLRRART